MGHRRAMQALFQSPGQDGADWLFIVRSDDGWLITRNGKEIRAGTGSWASISAGVAKYWSLTHDIVNSNAAYDAAVSAPLSRIEGGGPASMKIAKYQGRNRLNA